MSNEANISPRKAAVSAVGPDATAVKGRVNEGSRESKGSAQAGAASGKATSDTMQPRDGTSADTAARIVQEAADVGSVMLNGFTRALAEMRLPGMFDFAALAATHRRNMEAISTASHVTLQGAETVVRHEMEIMQQIIGELSETARVLMSAETPLARAALYAELSGKTYERTVTSIREVSDLIRSSHRETFDLLNQRALDTMTEIKEMLEKREPQQAHA